MGRRFLILSALAFATACGGDDGSIRIPEDGAHDTLSAWHLFSDLKSQTPADGVIPYDVVNPLFTDYAAKYRYLYVPEGETIDYDAVEPWQFPVGSIVIKTFAHVNDEGDAKAGERLIETRLLVHTEEGWEPEVYVYDASGEEAHRTVSGDVLPLTRKAADGSKTDFEYAVPTRSECRKCHGAVSPVQGAMTTRTLGPMTAQLNMQHDYGDGPVNQIDHLAALGLLDEKPGKAADRFTYPDPSDESLPVVDRVRAYLASNCAHCHSDDGEVLDKDLFLDFESTGPDADPYHYGVCKKPTSAGNADCTAELDIVPGDPDNSLLLCRMELVGKGQMAPLGRSLVHGEATALIRQWIEEMDLPDCSTGP